MKVKEKKEGKQKKTKRKEKTFIGEAPPPEIQSVQYTQFFKLVKAYLVFFAIDSGSQYLHIIS